MGDSPIIGWRLALATLYNLRKQVHPSLAKALLSWLESNCQSLTFILKSYFGNRQSFMIIWLQEQQRYDVITKSALKL